MSETIYAQIIGVQKELKAIEKNMENPFFKSDYADLAHVCDYLYPILTKNGLGISHTTEIINGLVMLKTVLFNDSGQSIISTLTLGRETDKRNDLAAAHTFFRRYAIMGLVGLSAKLEDSDGMTDVVPAPKKQDNTPRSAPSKAKPPVNHAPKGIIDEIADIAKSKGMANADVTEAIKRATGKVKAADCSQDELKTVLKYLELR